ncbi:MAG: hypothetical protein ACI9BW_003329 [Gammaproteobacteria bacterium]|jgi:hypothetical protein
MRKTAHSHSIAGHTFPRLRVARDLSGSNQALNRSLLAQRAQALSLNRQYPPCSIPFSISDIPALQVGVLSEKVQIRESRELQACR